MTLFSAPASPVALLILWIIFANCIAFLLFALDKRRSEQGGWRVPEARLLFWAAAGGWFGAKAAQKRFRHKTRKEPFRSQLNFALLPSLVAAAGLTALWLEFLPSGLGLPFSEALSGFISQDPPAAPLPRRIVMQNSP